MWELRSGQENVEITEPKAKIYVFWNIFEYKNFIDIFWYTGNPRVLNILKLEKALGKRPFIIRRGLL
mgnify:CR=1 FL=1